MSYAAFSSTSVKSQCYLTIVLCRHFLVADVSWFDEWLRHVFIDQKKIVVIKDMVVLNSFRDKITIMVASPLRQITIKSVRRWILLSVLNSRRNNTFLWNYDYENENCITFLSCLCKKKKIRYRHSIKFHSKWTS